MRDWDEHRLILAIERGGTLRAAADRLGVTHTTVSRRLAALEAGSPSPVFRRSGRSYVLTDHGRERVAIAEQIERLDHAALRLGRGSEGSLSGPLSLSAPRAFLHSAGLLKDLAAFRDAHPGIELTVVGSDSLADLDRGQADVALRGQIGPDPHLVGRLVSPVGLQYYGRRDYLESTPPERYGWIAAPAARDATGSGTLDWLAQSPYPDAPVTLAVGDIISRYRAVADGLGLGRLACFMAETDPELVPIGESPPVPFYDLWILTHPDLRNAPKVRALSQWLWDALAPRRASLAGRR